MMKDYDVFMQSVPAVGRTFYDGKVSVRAETDDEAIEIAISKAAKVHGHRDWIVESCTRILRR